MNANHTASTIRLGSALIASAVAAMLAGPAVADAKVPVTEWQQSYTPAVAPYLMDGRALAIGTGYAWRHLRDNDGRIYLEYRTAGGRTFVGLIKDPTVDEEDDDE